MKNELEDFYPKDDPARDMLPFIRQTASIPIKYFEDEVERLKSTGEWKKMVETCTDEELIGHAHGPEIYAGPLVDYKKELARNELKLRRRHRVIRNHVTPDSDQNGHQ